MGIGQNIRNLRTDAGMSQEELAERLDPPYMRPAVTAWESGRAKPRMDTVVQIAELFGVSVADLMGHGGVEPRRSSRRVPVRLMGSVHAGEWSEAVPDGVIAVIPEEVADRHPGAYLLRVEGTCMGNAYPEGCMVLVDPTMEPWSRFEAMEALAAPWQDPRLAAYLVLGLSGLRKEEALGARPLDVSDTTTYSVVTGDEVRTMVVDVRWTRTARGGHVEALKNGQSARVVPVLVPGRQLLRAAMRETREAALRNGGPSMLEAWASSPIVDMPPTTFDHRWVAALESMGLRPIPPKLLRHTSTTLMETAGVGHDLADKMHGRSDHGVAYRNYYRPDAALMEEAAGLVGDLLGPPPRTSPDEPGRDEGVPAGGEG